MANSNLTGNSNLLSPNALPDSVACAGQQRRKSTLSGNGFFIDYSCTRRRSSAVREQQENQARSQQFLRTYVSPDRYAALRGGSFCAGQERLLSSPSSPARAQSRASCSAASSVLAPPPLHTPFALAGSRKTSIFDPTGHSIGAAPQQLLARRKSTMIAAPLLAEPSSNTMMTVARRAAQNPASTRKGELAKHVPVIGCSPTSIQASLAALKETRRYEKLLRRLKRHQKRREKRRRRRAERNQLSNDDDDDDQDGDNRVGLHEKPALSLRRKSLRAIRGAAQTLSAGYRRDSRRLHNSTIDGISISSLSLGSNRASLPSLDRFEPNNDELFACDQDDDDDTREANFARSPEIGLTSQNRSPSGEGNKPDNKSSSSIVRLAMRKLASSIGATNVGPHMKAPKQRRQPKANRSISVGAGMNYWYYYYYYLRENSMEKIDDLPISATGGSSITSDAERRAQLHINYSLARIQILNSTTNPIEQLAQRIEAARIAMEASANSNSAEASPLSELFDFNQSTDVSLALSTSTSESVTTDNGSSPGDGDGHAASCSFSPTNNSSPANSGSSCGHMSHASSSNPSTSVPSTRSSMSADSRLVRQSFQNQNYLAHQQDQPRHSHSAQIISGGRGGESADDECTSVDIDPNHLSPSTMHSFRVSQGQRQGISDGEGGGAACGGTSSRRSASFAMSSQMKMSNEEELDDFDRFNQSHRGYKPATATPTPTNEELKRSSGGGGGAQATTTKEQKTIRERISNLRLSVKSARGSFKSRTSSSNSRSSLSWDTLASGTSKPIWAPSKKRPHQKSSQRPRENSPAAPANSDPSACLLSGASLNTATAMQHRLSSSNYFQAPQTSSTQQQDLNANEESLILVLETTATGGSNLKTNKTKQRNEQQANDLGNNHRVSIINSDKSPAAADLAVNKSAGIKNLPTWGLVALARDTSNKAQYAPDCWSNYNLRGHYEPAGVGLAEQAVKFSPTWACKSCSEESQTRARSHASIVGELEEAPALRQPQLRGAKVCPEKDEACLYERRRRLSSSLRVPKWAASVNNSASGETGAESRAGFSRRNVEATRLVRSNEGASSCAREQVELRARAHSTGASGNGIGTRDFARDQSTQTSKLARLFGNNNNTDNQTQTTRFQQANNKQRPDNNGAHDKQWEKFIARDKCEDKMRDDKVDVGGRSKLDMNQNDSDADADDNDDHRDQGEDKKQRESNIKVLNKKLFTCMLVGSIQSGKRTIVKCFIKLLNEFKLAADEYRKEKMLTKLMDCSEQLQDIANQRQEELAAIHLAAQQTGQRQQQQQPARSRLNSWFLGNNGSSSLTRLLNLPASVGGGGGSGAAKRRLHSFVGTTAAQQRTTTGHDGHSPENGKLNNSQQRRHTAILGGSGHALQLKVGENSRSGSRNAVNSLLGGDLHRNAQMGCNKSDSNINYNNAPEQAPASDSDSDIMSHKLQVPNIDWLSLGARESLLNDDTGDEFNPFHSKRSMGGSESLVQEESTRADPANRRSFQCHRLNRLNRPTLSLREINRRLVRIKFKTRRQLNERYLTQIDTSNYGGQSDLMPDSFMVVYAVNNRESFDYARSLICQLRNIKQDIPLPIVLVANKIDLERAKVVKTDEGRILAKRNGCKFIEISCTVGYNLDNLLVGLRSQLILKHHTTLNLILRNGKTTKVCDKSNETATKKADGKQKENVKNENILVRFYKRCVMDSEELNYECDNFSKL